MKNVHLKIAAAFLATVAFSGVAHAQIVGESSDTSNIAVGTSGAFGPHQPNRPGIGFPSSPFGSAIVDVQTLQTYVPADTNGVSEFTPSNIPHGDLGYFNLSRVGANEVWFGEWTSDGNVGSGDQTVYFVGRDQSAAPTVATTATYDVKGINDYQTNGALLTGTLTANFNGSGGGTVGGSLTGHQTVSLSNVGISGATFSTANGGAASIAGGSAEASGSFFGSNVAAIAGVVTSNVDRSLDTAFGGSRTN
ncbi:Slam-dependent surface lipoprotein [Sphingobium sp. YR768]|uniref:Slam-dependent surface lipoprotein n=1 Tax=Sphingobium sp. YR768 TaxID=1884365 RepID=UPI0008B61303|nr:Slam-dependent surface lipoprotein [Sphingobium sp. YR768]SES12038.1 hypothetical protein SAMN05518866_14113 [Sphingobium sp. YR768]